MSRLLELPPVQKLTPRRQKFVLAYMATFDAKAGAREAGYAPGSAAERGYEQLQRADVQQALAACVKQLTAKHEVTAERLMDELARTAFGDGMGKFTRRTSDGGIEIHIDEDADLEMLDGFTVDKATGRVTSVKLKDQGQAIFRLFKMVLQAKQHEPDSGQDQGMEPGKTAAETEFSDLTDTERDRQGHRDFLEDVQSYAETCGVWPDGTVEELHGALLEMLGDDEEETS